MKEIQAIVDRLCRDWEGGVLVTLVSVEGSSYRRAGARILVPNKGARIGSISGGCLEEDLILRSARAAESGRPELVTYDTSADNDEVWGVGLGCHGTVRILVEPLPRTPAWAPLAAENLRLGRATELAVVWRNPGGPVGTWLKDDQAVAATDSGAAVFHDRIGAPTSLTLFGAGDDALPLARLAAELGWRLTVADPRPAMTTPERFPGAFALVLGPADELVARAAPPPGSLAVIMTHHYRHDLPLLRHLLPLPLAYLGLLGPRRRAERLLADLSKSGMDITPAMRALLRAPVGLDVGADGPEEVALSIAAEMSAVLAGRDGRPLRDRDLPIHA
jgi:xanthine/CO dehydrogenase XdhC/CoxF family maturation factor